MRRVYLDHAATTPLDPRVFEAMTPFLKEAYGNASSVHALGRRARFAVEESRERVAALLGAEPGEIVFTSGGTEADNLAVKGASGGGEVVTSAAEHEAVLRPAEALKAAGRPVTILDPGSSGAATPEQVRGVLHEEVGLVSLMHTNNETGARTDVPAVGAVCRAAGIPFHCDAVQAPGLAPLDVDDLGVDLLTLSAHKFNGPKGAGVLYVRGGTDLQPLVEGGAQERKRRGGTENVAAIVGLAEALTLACEDLPARAAHIAGLRDRLYRGLRGALGEAFVCNTPLGDPAARVAPHILNVSFPPADGGDALDGEMLLLNLDMEGIMASAGSACTSGAIEPSHVLLALGRDRATAAATVRFSLGHANTEDEIDFAVGRLAAIVRRMRGTEPAAARC